MYSGQGVGWGIILMGAWGIWAMISCISNNFWSKEFFPPRIAQGLLCMALVLALVDPKIMYAQVASANPVLLSLGPIQILPKTTAFYLQAVLILSLALLCVLILQTGEERLWHRVAGMILVVLSASSHLLVYRLVPFPLIDVFTTISEASVAILEGRNPYGMAYTDIYHGQGLTPTGFGYLPGIFPWSIFGLLMGGDVRMGNFFALAGTALLFLFWGNKKTFSSRCVFSCLLFYGGAGLFVAEQAWIDPVLFFLIVATACCLERNHEALAGCLAGLLCTTKQYGVVAFVFLCLMLISRKNIRGSLWFIMLALGIGALVQIPFWIWNLPLYWKTVVVGVGQLPFRPDAYTLVSLASCWGIPVGGIPWIGFGFFLLLVWKLWNRKSIGIQESFFCIALAYLWIFLTNRHAFCNYYQLVFLLLVSCAALGSSHLPEKSS